jgi:hypothetical protein
MSLYNDSQNSNEEKIALKEKIDVVRGLFPQKLSEAEINTNK